MTQVLHIMACADAGGISSVVLNYYRFLDRTRIHFDIALTVPQMGQNAHALEDLGAGIFYLPLKSQGMKAFRDGLRALLRKKQYDAIHVHESETCYVALMVAKQMGVPIRIAHAHTCSPWEGVKGEIRRLSGCLLNYPVAAVEALSAGLPTLLSDAVTEELKFATGAEYLPLDQPEAWLRAIGRWQSDTGRTVRQTEPEANGLDIRSCARRLEKIYLEG